MQTVGLWSWFFLWSLLLIVASLIVYLGFDGTGDDLTLAVDSVVPGRKKTFYLIRIAQAMVTKESSTNLTGDWTVDRSDFGMGSALEVDGWGKAFEEAMSTRTLLSAGPDGDYLTAADNIPPGVIPDLVATGGTDIIFVPGSADMEDGNCQDVHFQIKNDTNKMIWVDSMTISYSYSGVYFIEVKVDGDEVAKDQDPLLSSGQLLEFTKWKIKKGQTLLVEMKDFEDRSDGNGQPVGMGSIDFTITFSDGSVLTFTTDPCDPNG